MEALLQLMLKWDPVQRGGRVNSDNKKPLCFEVLEQILSMKASYFTFYLILWKFFEDLTVKCTKNLIYFVLIIISTHLPLFLSLCV